MRRFNSVDRLASITQHSIPSFCIIGTFLIYGYQWSQCKNGKLSPLVSVIYGN